MTPWIFTLILYFAPGAEQRIVFSFPTEELCGHAQAHLATATAICLGSAPSAPQVQGHAVEVCWREPPATRWPGLPNAQD